MERSGRHCRYDQEVTVLKYYSIRGAKRLACAAGLAIVFAGCSAAGLRNVPPTAPLSYQANDRQTPLPDKKSKIVFSPSALALFGKGKSNAETLIVSEQGYSGGFTWKNDCSKVVAIRPTARKAGALKVSGTPLQVGACTVVFEDSRHNTAKLRVTDRRAAGRLKFTIAIPSKKTFERQKSGMGSNYVSPNTQAVTITTTSGPTQETVTLGLSVISSGCTSNFGGLTCTLSLDLAPCESSSGNDSSNNCYIADVSAYDAFDGTSNTIPAGAAVLSIAQNVSFSVDADQTSNVAFQLSGVPAQLVAVAADSTSSVSGSTITLTGLGTHPFFADAYDADGNPITGLGAPTFTVAASPAAAVTLTTPPPGSPRFTVAVPSLAHYAPTVQLTLNAKYPAGETDACAQPGAVCQTQYAMNIALITDYYSSGLLAGGNSFAIAAGPDGALWFTDNNNGAIGRMTTSGSGTEYRTGLVGLYGITAGADGNLWFASNWGTIGKITPSGAIAQYSSVTNGMGAPDQITSGPDGNLWFPADPNSIGTITTAGVATVYSPGIPTFGSGGTGIASGPDGRLWFADGSPSNGIGAITTSGVVTLYTSGISPNASPYQIASGPDGNLWFTETGKIGKITTAGVVTEYSTGITGSVLVGITAGPDGGVWFAEADANRIASITTNGVVTEFPLPPGGPTDPQGVTAGPDGNIWFTHCNGAGIGKLELSAAGSSLRKARGLRDKR
jgi:streptogramin lyase